MDAAPPSGGGSSGGGSGGGGGGGAADDIGGDPEDVPPCGGACTTPPAPTCASDCQSMDFQATGSCVSGQCAYEPRAATDCENGCDPATGLCRTTPDPSCAGLGCGEASACGATCSAGSGCCVTESYSKSSGFTYNGYQLCCDAGDTRTGVSDCGSGSNHSASASGANCGTAYEGSNNYGGPCVSLTCERTVCM